MTENNQATFTVVIQVRTLMDDANQTVTPTGVMVGLETSPNINKAVYFEPNGTTFNSKGCAAFLNTAVEGIIAAANVAEQKGWEQKNRVLQGVINRLTASLSDSASVVKETAQKFEGSVRMTRDNKPEEN